MLETAHKEKILLPLKIFLWGREVVAAGCSATVVSPEVANSSLSQGGKLYILAPLS